MSALVSTSPAAVLNRARFAGRDFLETCSLRGDDLIRYSEDMAGKTNGRAKLSVADVELMRRQFSRDEMSTRELAQQHGLDQAAIWRALTGKTYAYVPGAVKDARPTSGVAYRGLSWAEKVWTHVQKSDGCWLWTGHKNSGGYGVMFKAGRPYLAHRVVWEIENGSAGELGVLHRCDIPLCVRPEHLFVGTNADNVADKTAKMRQARGDGHGRSKLTAAIVLEMRKQYAKGEVTQAELARRHNVDHAAIRRALLGETWRSVP